MNSDRLVIRPMSSSEVSLAAEWAAREGWNPGLDDAHVFYETDPGGFLMGTLDDQPVSVISAVRYGEAYGFVGFYIVDPAFRGRGFGMKTWTAAMSVLGDRLIGLDGVVDQQDNYRKSGFEFAHRNIRQEGRVEHGASPGCFVDAAQLAPEMIQAFDRQFFPAPRDRFLGPWMQLPHGSALARVEQDRIRSLGVIRECRNGWKIGPLFADSPDDARALFGALQLNAKVGAPLYLDTPEPNAQALELARRHGMQPVFETARMYRGNRPDIDLDKVFGITTFELG